MQRAVIGEETEQLVLAEIGSKRTIRLRGVSAAAGTTAIVSVKVPVRNTIN